VGPFSQGGKKGVGEKKKRCGGGVNLIKGQKRITQGLLQPAGLLGHEGFGGLWEIFPK